MEKLITFILDNSNNRKEQRFKQFFPNEYEEISSWEFPNDFKFSQKLYHYINNDKNLLLGRCPVCGNRCEWRGFGVEYLTYCSKKCTGISQNHRQNISIGMNNRTDEEKAKTRQLQSEKRKQLSKEQKEEISNKRLKTINEKGEDFINEFRQRQKQSLINTLKSKSDEEKQKESIRKSTIWKNKSEKDKQYQIDLMHKGLSDFHKDTIKHSTWIENVTKANQSKSDSKIKNAKDKEWETKIKRCNINTSTCENNLECWLISNNIKYYRNYNKDSRYPYHVDFYLPEYDLFIEIQGHWSHGNHPFNESDLNDIKLLEIWKEKSSNFYQSAINVWTKKDVEKRNVAKNNKLNYLEIFTINSNIIIETVKKRISLN